MLLSVKISMNNSLFDTYEQFIFRNNNIKTGKTTVRLLSLKILICFHFLNIHSKPLNFFEVF